MRRICGLFFFLEFIYVFREILSTSMLFCCSIYIERAQNSRGECKEFADFLFSRRLSRDSLSSDTRSLDLCILFKFIFSYPWYIRLILPLFTHFTLHQFFLMNIIILAVKGLIRTICFFLTFAVLIQWNFPWNISANLLIFTNKASSHVVIEWKPRMCQSCYFEVGCHPFL